MLMGQHTRKYSSRTIGNVQNMDISLPFANAVYMFVSPNGTKRSALPAMTPREAPLSKMMFGRVISSITAVKTAHNSITENTGNNPVSVPNTPLSINAEREEESIAAAAARGIVPDLVECRLLAVVVLLFIVIMKAADQYGIRRELI